MKHRSMRATRRPLVSSVWLALMYVATLNSAVLASPLPPGQTISVAGVSAQSEPSLMGQIVIDTAHEFTINDEQGNTVITGLVQDRVVRSSATGRLIFMPRVHTLGARNDAAWVFRIQATGYSGYEIDVAYRTDGDGEIGPLTAQRNSGTGDQLTFSYGLDFIQPPDEGNFLVIRTRADHCNAHGTMIIEAQNDVKQLLSGEGFTTTINGVTAPATSGGCAPSVETGNAIFSSSFER